MRAKVPMTRFIPVGGSPAAVAWLLKEPRESLTVVSRHGLGDNVFFSPCFEPLARSFGKVFLGSSVNAYISLFHESPWARPLYAGGTNANNLGLVDAKSFVDHFDALGLDLGVGESFVYHYGLFEPDLPYSDPRAFVKGRRNIIEMGLPTPPATAVPRYHVAPDLAGKPMVDAVLDRWYPDRELIAIARAGHTDPDKNFGDDQREALAMIDIVDRVFPGRFKYISLDYAPAGGTSDGHRANVRSVYGFLPCDGGSLYHILARSRLLVTVPTGPMLVGSTIPGLPMLTLWKSAVPFHYLDPQHEPKVWAMIEGTEASAKAFMEGWTDEERAAVVGRWKLIPTRITPESVALGVLRILKGEADVPNL